MFRDGIKMLLSDQANIEIVGEAGDGDELLELVESTLPDIVIADITMPGMSGIEVTRKIRCRFNSIKVLILSMHNTSEFILNAIEAGASGFLPKDTGHEELVKAIFDIANGEQYFNKNITSTFIKGYSHISKQKEHDPKNLLSKRELEILKLFSEGYSNPEISEKLFISIRTVESHKTHIMQKLGLKSQVEMIKIAIRYNITDL
jgi:DNA-binding NarL/FixJ family response regulator